MPRTPFLLTSLVAFTGCSGALPEEPAPRSYPEGTVLVVDEQPILAADVDRFVDAVALIEPEFVLRDHRRKVLSNISIPLAAGAALDPASRDQAFTRAQALLSAFRETGELPEGAPQPRVLSGTFKEIGLIPWAFAIEMEPLTISELHETPGAWSFFRLTASTEAPGESGGRSQVTILRYDVPYLPEDALRGLIQTAMQGIEIEIVDPAWEPMVPPAFLYPAKAQ